jgi:signal transduction histidine kinase
MVRLSLRNIAVSESWFNRLVIGAIALGFFALLISGVAAFQAVRDNQFHSLWVNHTFEVERAIANFDALMERAETGRRGYLLSGEANTGQTYDDASRQLGAALDRLRDLTKDNIRQQANVAKLTALTERDLALMDASVRQVRAGHREQAVRNFQDALTLQLMRSVRSQLEAMRAEESRLLEIRNQAQRQTLHIFYDTIVIAGIILTLVGVGSIWVILRYTRDLTRSSNELRLLNTDLEGAVRERTTDLQRANDEIQRFAYIVSHDLRAPLVNVMGFTAELESATGRLTRMMDKVAEQAPELIDKDAQLAAREDLPEAISFIRTSTEKMDRLINAILRLSREGRRPITPERLDMNAVAQNIADTHRHLLDDKEIDFSIVGRLPSITSDRLAIEQIVGNIAENAIKYMPPGRRGRIELRGRIEGQRAVFEVADNGRGIDPKDHERIFDLFRRSGAQDQPGEGIGLAHTRALAYRLGGTISVESELGRGATFRINLPVAFVGEQEATR